MRSILAFFLFFGLTAAAGAQTLNPGDTIAISVYQDSKLDRQIVIGPTGFISFPLAGQVRAGGLTPEGLENALKARLKDKYATDLDVTVTLVAVSREREREREKERIEDELKPRIFVTGEVQKPGPFFMRQRTTVLQAIALSGGFGPYAARRRIQIHRRVNGVESILVFDYAAFEAGDDARGNIDLRPGDVIIVPERGLFE